MPREYKSYPPERAQYLWAVGYGTKMDGEVVDLHDTHLLQTTARDGTEVSYCFGPAAITLWQTLAVMGHEYHLWCNCASAIISFPSTLLGEIKNERSASYGDDRPMWAIALTRESLAKAIRGYRRRRDEMIRNWD